MLAALLVLAGCDDDGGSRVQVGGLVTVPAADLEGPVEGPPVIVSTFFDLGALGYVQEEFFVSGTANAYVNVNELQPDGFWQVQADTRANYRTRAVVIRPIDAADFNGTVLVEWLNVSAGFDSAPDWGMLHTELIRSGYAWVGLSAQEVGVTSLLDGSAAQLVGIVAGDRYASLSHPGDGYSYDIYSQVGQALRTPGATPLLGDLAAQTILAAGESQSAGRLMTYINALAPIHGIYDGYFVHSRTTGSSPLQGGIFDATIATPEVVRVRTDIDKPVMMLQTETDLFVLGSYPSNQPDFDNFRLWEVAGTAHADLYTFLDNRFDIGDNPAIAAVVENKAPIPGIIDCPVPVNAGPQHFVAKAAVHALNEWVVNGVAPPTAERLAVSGEPPAFELDALGNVLGGIRTPYVDVPIAILSGEGQPEFVFDPENPELDVESVDFCFLSGTTELFDAATLGSLYESNADYIERLNASADEAVAGGFLLAPDAQLIKDNAARSDIFAP